jgi:hypothetical protein
LRRFSSAKKFFGFTLRALDEALVYGSILPCCAGLEKRATFKTNSDPKFLNKKFFSPACITEPAFTHGVYPPRGGVSLIPCNPDIL